MTLGGSVKCFMMYGGQKFKTVLIFKRFALKCTCVPYYVSSSFMCFFLMKFGWRIQNVYTNIFWLQKSRKNSPRTNQEVLAEDAKCVPRFSKIASHRDGNRRPIGGGNWSKHRLGRLRYQNTWIRRKPCTIMTVWWFGDGAYVRWLSIVACNSTAYRPRLSVIGLFTYYY